VASDQRRMGCWRGGLRVKRRGLMGGVKRSESGEVGEGKGWGERLEKRE